MNPTAALVNWYRVSIVDNTTDVNPVERKILFDRGIGG